MLTWIWIGWRSIQQRGLASFLTATSMALGVTLVVAVLLVVGVVDTSFRNNLNLGYGIIVGPKGGSLQLVLNSVFFLSTPIERALPYTFYQDFLTKEKKAEQLGLDPATQEHGKYVDYVAYAIPICMGDYYQQYRVVGTIPEMFDRRWMEQVKDDKFEERTRKYEFSAGRNFQRYSDEHAYFEAVVGSTVAYEAGLKVGDKFNPSHGSAEGAKHDPFTIVGILAPTGTPYDRGCFVNMEGFYLMEGHAGDYVEAADKTKKKIYEPLPLAHRKVSAILVRSSHPILSQGLTTSLNRGLEAQAALPVREIYNLFDLTVKPVQYLLLVITALICVVSGIGILVSIYNSMNDRKHDIAIMRALGASRWTVSGVVLMESAMLALGGGLAGWLLGHVLIYAANPWIVYYSGVHVGLFDFAPPLEFLPFSPELILVPALILLALIVGFLPAVTAYRTDVSQSLAK